MPPPPPHSPPLRPAPSAPPPPPPAVSAEYRGADPDLQGHVMRLAKECATDQFRGTPTGHPDLAYNQHVMDRMVPFLGVRPSPGVEARPPPPLPGRPAYAQPPSP